MLNTTSRNTPEPVRRILRQESGFGCCFCGVPFLQYHHIIAWAVEEHSRPEDMMAVCATHHGLITEGAISEPAQRAAKANPHNLRHGSGQGALYVTTPELKVKFGGCVVTNTPVLLQIAGVPVVVARRGASGEVLLSAPIQDENGDELGRLVDNDWDFSPGLIWDFEVHGRWATAKLGPRNINLLIDCRQPHVQIRGKWWSQGEPVEFGPKGVTVGDRFYLEKADIHNCFCAISI